MAERKRQGEREGQGKRGEWYLPLSEPGLVVGSATLILAPNSTGRYVAACPGTPAACMPVRVDEDRE